jgi:hypothetical protein
MKIRALALTAALLAVSGSANAFFFFIPVGAIQNAVQGGHCVPQTAKAGDKINLGGKTWVVKETNGVSSRCSQYPNWPVIAKLEPYVSEAELAAELQVCLPMGATEGATTVVYGIGEVYVRSVSTTGSNCSDVREPVSARVVRVKYANPPLRPQESTKATDPAPTNAPQLQPATAPVAEQPKPPTRDAASVGAVEPPKLVPVVATQPPLKETKTVVERLRELKQLRDENLITESLYESKQKEILSSQ